MRDNNSLLKSASSHVAVWELAYLEVEPLFSLAVCYGLRFLGTSGREYQTNTEALMSAFVTIRIYLR
jgi:hypothetical protein